MAGKPATLKDESGRHRCPRLSPFARHPRGGAVSMTWHVFSEQRRSKTMVLAEKQFALSAFICVHPRPTMFSSHA
jgi:hypothetical protein